MECNKLVGFHMTQEVAVGFKKVGDSSCETCEKAERDEADLQLVQLSASTVAATAVPVRWEVGGWVRGGGGGAMRRRPQISHLCHRWKMWRLSHPGGLRWRIRCRETKTMEIEGWSGARLCFLSCSSPATCSTVTLTLDIRYLLSRHFGINNCRHRTDFTLPTSRDCLTTLSLCQASSTWYCVAPVLCVLILFTSCYI